MTTRGDVALGTDITLNGVRYALANEWTLANEGSALAWRRALSVTDEEDGPTDFGPGRPVPKLLTAEWIIDRKMGHGRAKSSRTRGLGVAASIGWDDSIESYIRLTSSKFSVTPTAPTTDVATYGFEELISATTNYYMTQRYTYRMTVDAAGAITIGNETDHGATAVAGRPRKFDGVWQLPLGMSDTARRLTTPSSNTFDDYTGSQTAFTAFATIMDGAGSGAAKIAGSQTSTVTLIAAAPHSGTWGDSFEVGDSTSRITNLDESGIILVVAKTDNCFIMSSNGVAQPLFNTGSGKGVSTNGLGLVAIPGTEAAGYNHDTGLHFINGLDVYMNRGPDGVPSRVDIPNVTLEPYQMQHYESAYCGNWFYTIGRVTSGGSTRSFIYGVDLRTVFNRNPHEMAWHLVGVEDSWVRGLYIDTSKRLWYTTNGTIAYRVLGRDGSPNGNTSGNYGNVSTTYRVFLEGSDYGMPGVNKQYRGFKINMRGIDADAPAQIESYIDGGSAVNVGSTITANGVTARFYTQNSNDAGYVQQPAIMIATGAGYDVGTDDPQVWSLTGYAMPLYDKADYFRCVIDTGMPYSSGAGSPADSKAQRDALDALKGGVSITGVDPDGNSLSLHIEEVNDLETYQTPIGGIGYIVEVLARERRTA